MDKKKEICNWVDCEKEGCGRYLDGSPFCVEHAAKIDGYEIGGEQTKKYSVRHNKQIIPSVYPSTLTANLWGKDVRDYYEYEYENQHQYWVVTKVGKEYLVNHFLPTKNNKKVYWSNVSIDFLTRKEANMFITRQILCQ